MKRLTDEEVKKIFSYDDNSGEFTIVDATPFLNTKNNIYTVENVQSAISVHIESRTKAKNLKVNVYGRQYVVAKLIWQWVYGGGYLTKKLFHKDGNNLNNKLCNLKIQAERPIDIQCILDTIDYDPIKGTFFKNKNAPRYKNRQILNEISDTRYTNYCRAVIGGREVSAQQVAWIHMKGTLPNNLIDHIDGDTTNNKWSNLREVTEVENSRNQKINRKNKSGHMGVRITTAGNYTAYITGHNLKRIHLGTFSTYEKAVNAREEAELKYEYHKNHGREL